VRRLAAALIVVAIAGCARPMATPARGAASPRRVVAAASADRPTPVPTQQVLLAHLEFKNIRKDGQPAADGTVIIVRYRKVDYRCVAVGGACAVDALTDPEYEIDGSLEYWFEADPKTFYVEAWRRLRVAGAAEPRPVR